MSKERLKRLSVLYAKQQVFFILELLHYTKCTMQFMPGAPRTD